MSELTPEQFASAVSDTLGSVHHLYREIHRLITSLKEYLAEPSDSLTLLGGTTAGAGKDQGRLVVRNEYALLFKPSSDDEEEEGDDEEMDADDAYEEESASPKRKRPPATFTSSDRFLGIVVSIYDPRGTETFEPHLSYGVMSDWSVGEKLPDPAAKLILARYMLRRIPKAIAQPGLQKGDRAWTKATVKSAPGFKKAADRRLSCAVPNGVQTIRLFDLNSADALLSVVEAMKAMYRESPNSPVSG